MAQDTKLTKQAQAEAQEIHDRPAIAPAVDIFENEAGYVFIADLPGVCEDDIKIDLHKGELSLQATRNADTVGEAIAAEFEPVDYRRTFKIPDVIDATKIEAELKHGVLTLRLPKSDGVRPRTIEVRAG